MTMQPTKSEIENLTRLLKLAREEDLGGGDITSSLIRGDIPATGKFVSRQPMVLCGGVFLEEIACYYDESICTRLLVEDGRHTEAGEVLAEWKGPARSMLSAERVALNFLQRLCGVATITSDYVREVENTGAEIFDTRKTTPGWRELEKYAVRAGGGRNHRMGLYDSVLVKDNHLALMAIAQGCDPITSLSEQFDKIRPSLQKDAFIELEVDNIDQFARALSLPVDIILLDNMPPTQVKLAVEMRDMQQLAEKIELEASGGITMENVRKFAETGVERIAIGALTHSACAVDIAMEIDII